MIERLTISGIHFVRRTMNYECWNVKSWVQNQTKGPIKLKKTFFETE